MTAVEQTRNLNAIKLNKGENLAKLFDKLKVIDNQFSNLTNGLFKDNKIANVSEKTL